MEQKIKNLMDFSKGILHKENVKELYQKYFDEIQGITPQELMLVQYEQLKTGMTPREVLDYADKLINVLHKPLSKYEWKQPEEGTFLYYLMAENRELIKRLEAFRTVIKQNDLMQQCKTVKDFVRKVMEYEEHLLKLENILFPYMEKMMERYQGLRIMWSLHDEVRKQWRGLISLLDERDPDERDPDKQDPDKQDPDKQDPDKQDPDKQDPDKQDPDKQDPDKQTKAGGQSKLDGQTLNAGIGRLYFNLYGLVQKQELILFPCAVELLDESDFAEMHKQSFDYAFPFIDPPDFPASDNGREKSDGTEARPGTNPDTASGQSVDDLQKLFVTDTGHLDFEQLCLLLNAIPIDLTFVDEQDRVVWFSKPKDRVFPRSAAVIGRNVKNCHPPESVHVVETILDSFRTGEKSEAEFWIRMKGKFIHIRYVALRDLKGSYRGTLEMTQEISALRALEGEKRLLDWK